MAPSGPVLLPPLRRELVGEDASLPAEDSLAESSAESVSEGERGESYP